MQKSNVAGVRAGGYVDGRVRRLQGRRRQADFVEVVELAFVGVFLLGPEALHYVDALLEMLLAGFGGYAESAVLVAIDAAPEAYVEASAA